MNVVVTLSGVFEVDEVEKIRGEELIQKALSNWNFPEKSVDRPFVTVHNKASNKHKPVGEDAFVGTLNEEDVVRVVLPLMNMGDL